MMKIKNNNQGFTLIEVIITTVIMTIIMGLTLGMITSSGSMFTSNAEMSLNKQIGDSVFDLMGNNIKYATQLEIESSSDKCIKGYNNAMGVNSSGNYFYKNNSNTIYPYSNGFYQGRKIQYKIEPVFLDADNKVMSTEHVKLTVIVNDKNGKTVYTRSNTIKCLNLDISASNSLYYKAGYGSNIYNQYISFTKKDLVLQSNDQTFKYYYNLSYIKSRYNEINQKLALWYNNPQTPDALTPTQAQSQISDLFGGFSPPQDNSLSGQLPDKFKGVYANYKILMYGTLNKYYNGIYPSFDNSSAFFKDTYFQNNNMNMAIAAYFKVTPTTISNNQIVASQISDFVIYSVERNQLNTDQNTIKSTYQNAYLLYNTGNNCWYYQPYSVNIVTDGAVLIGKIFHIDITYPPYTYNISNRSSGNVNDDINRGLKNNGSNTLWMPVPNNPDYNPTTVPSS